MTVSEDRVFDLMVELVDFASVRGLRRTEQALEGALDAFLQDRGLAPPALPPPSGPALSSQAPSSPARTDAASSHTATPMVATTMIAAPVIAPPMIAPAVLVPPAPLSGADFGAVPCAAGSDMPPLPAPPCLARRAPATADDPAAGEDAVQAAVTAPDPVLAEAAFRSRRPVTRPRRLHLLPSQRVAV